MATKKLGSKSINDELTRLGFPQKGSLEKLCSFCGKGEHDAVKLMAGASVFICNECVRKLAKILDELGID